MVSQDKLIKQSLKYTDKLFDEIKRRLTHDISKYNTLEEYLNAHQDYLVSNPLTTTGYDQVMTRLISQSVTNVKFSRQAQRQLTQITIENTVGELIRNVGEDIKSSVREIVKEGFANKEAPRDIAKNIEAKIDGINSTRARAIARTEVKRANTVSNYIVAKERGATGFYVDCHPEACPLCVEAYGEGNRWSDNPNNNDKGGDNVYAMEDTDMLPPLHPT